MDVEKLISAVLHRVPIWNQAHADHLNRHVLNKLWIEIAIELNVTRDAAQKKWKYLRDYFQEEFERVQKFNSGDQGGNKGYKSKWRYYESLKFLGSQMKYNLTQKPIYSSQLYPSSKNSSQSDTEPAIVKVEPHNDSLPQENGSNENIEEELGETCADEPGNYIPTRKRKKRTETIGDVLVKKEKQKLNYLKSKEGETATERSSDEDKDFFSSLLPHVKRISPESKLLFRNEIQSVVQHFAYGEHYFHVERPASSHNTSVNSPTDSFSGYCPILPEIEIDEVLETMNSNVIL